jgi:hypothetical protein
LDTLRLSLIVKAVAHQDRQGAAQDLRMVALRALTSLRPQLQKKTPAGAGGRLDVSA